MNVIIANMKQDDAYTWGWHCNIAMSAFDAGADHETANEAASRFIQLLTGINTRTFKEHPYRQSSEAITIDKPSKAPGCNIQWDWTSRMDAAHDGVICGPLTIVCPWKT